MGQNDNALFLGLGEDRFHGLGVVGHDGDDIHALVDQVFHHLYLLGGVGLRRADHVGVHAQFLPGLLDSFLQAVEPGDSGDLNHHCDLGYLLGLLCLLCRGCGRWNDTTCGHKRDQGHNQRDGEQCSATSVHVDLPFALLGRYEVFAQAPLT